jgi:hypothetical protein
VKRKVISIAVILGLLVSLIVVPAQAATPEDIEQSIQDGLAWLVAQQDTSGGVNHGSWDAYSGYLGAGTGLALYKLCERAYELNDPDIESPFDPDYEYHQNVIDGFTWLFAHLTAVAISDQDHTAGATGTIDDPDTRINGFGVRTSTGPQIYTTGILLAAIAASGTPDRPNEGGMDVDGDTVIDTYQEIAQDIVDFLAFAQSDGISAGHHGNTLQGGWEYHAIDNGNPAGGWMSDQSNSGYAVLGLATAQAFGCTIPDWVKTELNWWIDWVQDDVTGDPNDGGSWYSYPGGGIGVNTLKTGNLIFQMALVGDTPATARVQDALDYLERHWGDAGGVNSPAGWGGNPAGTAPAQYQAMFCLMKGLEYMGIDTFGAGPIDWFEDFSDAIVAQQDKTVGPTYGSWQSSSGRGEPVIITEWALLTLEKIAPPRITEVSKHYSYTNVCFEKDNDGDGLFNEDPPEEFIDNDGDGVVDEDPIDGIDNDGDLLIDEDPSEQVDNDGDLLLNEDDVDCPEGTYLGDPLPADLGDPENPDDDTYLLEAVINPKNDKVSSYNPGQYYAVSTVNVLSGVGKLTIEEEWGDCGIGELNPKNGGGKVVIVMVGEDGIAYQILDAQDEAVIVDPVAGTASVVLEDVPGGTTILMYVKFKPTVKEWTGELECINYNRAWVGEDRPEEPESASANLMLIAKD